MIRASILGASGYSGGELIKLLSRHPHVQLDRLFANQAAGTTVASQYPWFQGSDEQQFESYEVASIASSDVIFLALPSGQAMNLAPMMLQQGKVVIDLGGDFRLQRTADYERYYKAEHTAPELLPQAIYGSPEWNAAEIKEANLIANPGCYPTSIILPLAPLVKDGLIECEGITINALSGVSGAGRKASLDLAFTEVNESVKAYKVGTHQHIPEIGSAIESLTGSAIGFSFIPHLIPITRGIFTTITAQLTSGVTLQSIEQCYAAYYSNAPFVKFRSKHVPEIKHVAHTNLISIGFDHYEGSNTLVIHSAIDNLLKGAAGQAVQNLNLRFGFSECEALR